MADMKMGRREWTVEADFSEGEAPDTAKRYSGVVIRPDCAKFRFSAHGEREPGLSSVWICGPRVNKDSLGARHSNEWYSRASLPEWLRELADQAKELTRG